MLNWPVKHAQAPLTDDWVMENEFKMIGQRIKETRLSKGLTQAPLAKAAGITVSALSQIESGTTKSPTPDTLFRIADALDVEARYLVFGHLDPVSPALSALRFGDAAKARMRRYRS